MGRAVEGLGKGGGDVPLRAVLYILVTAGNIAGSLLMGKHQHDEVHAAERCHQGWSVEERLGYQVGSLISSGILFIASHEEARCHLETGGKKKK